MSEILVTEMPFLCEVHCWGWEQNQHSIFCAVRGGGRGGGGGGEAKRFIQAPLLVGAGGTWTPAFGPETRFKSRGGPIV